MPQKEVVNIYFEKRLIRRVPYAREGQSTQVGYIVCRMEDLKQVANSSVLSKEAVAKQHKLVACTVRMQQLKYIKPITAKKLRRWKLSGKEYKQRFFQEVEAKLIRKRRGKTEHSSKRNGKKCTRMYIRKGRKGRPGGVVLRYKRQ